MSDEPLHVKVAEVLGWQIGNFAGGQWWGLEPPDHQAGWPIPRYDTDWSATGPLIERFGITLKEDAPGWHACERGAHEGIEFGSEGWHEGRQADGDAPLVAVCNLILALHAAGKLAA